MIIDGKKLAAEKIESLVGLKKPQRICFISFVDNLASAKFMAIKSKVATSVGIENDILKPVVETTEEAIEYIKEIEKDYDDIVVQLPLKENMEVQKVLNAIPYEKDVDLLSTKSLEAFRNKKTNRFPPVVWAVREILKEGKVDLATSVISNMDSKKIAILGKGRLVGEPMADYLKREEIDFDQIDIETPKEEVLNILKNADIVISGIGVAHNIKPEMIKEGVVLIDAGTSDLSGKLAGDIDPSCQAKAGLFTPVPGGVGPLTVVGLFYNIFEAL